MQEQIMQTQGGAGEEKAAAFNAVVESMDGDKIVLRLPRSNYQLHLAAPRSENGRTLTAGQRVRGIVLGESLRMYPAHGGGKFIEPIWGEPRIVAGTVLEADEAQRLVTVDAAAVFKLSVPAHQNFAVLTPGTLVNFYLKSGAKFLPAD